jgi:prepilin-type processing-associated H-X9-DG protein
VFARAREKARQASCASNEKQIGLAMLMYADDYDGMMPVSHQAADEIPDFAGPGGVYNWIACLHPYTKNWKIFSCPSAARGFTCGCGVPISGDSVRSYLVNNVLLSAGWRPGARSLAVVPNPSEIIFCHEEGQLRFCARPRPYLRWAGFYNNWLVSGSDWDLLHNDGANLLFCDGHVKWRKAAGIAAVEFGLNSSQVGPGPAQQPAWALW